MKTTTPAKSFSVFISSPGGLDADRSVVMDEIMSLSKHGLQKGTPSISAVSWPDDIAAGAALYAQSVINRQTAHYDILVCLIGTRMGTPTPRANSGTEEEFDQAMEVVLSGTPVQVLLFFSNMPVRPHDLDPNQLLLVRAFREKASRLGVLYHMYSDPDELRQRLRVSLIEAYNFLCGISQKSTFLPAVVTRVSDTQLQTIHLGDITLRNRNTAPQWADSYHIPLAQYRRQDIRLTWTIKASSSYFRFGFKYYDSREALFSAGSIQTVGQNIVFHVGKNSDNPTWFGTSYRGSIRIGSDRPLIGTAGHTTARFVLDISSTGSVVLYFEDNAIYEVFFPIDGIPILSLLAWGDEHEFECEVYDLTIHVGVQLGVTP